MSPESFTGIMRIWRSVLALCVFALAVGSAHAATMHMRARGFPAVDVPVPAGWTYKKSACTTTVTSRDSTAAVFVSYDTGQPLESVAAAEMKDVGSDPPRPRGTMHISGYAGNLYFSETINQSGARVYLQLVLIALDQDKVLSVLLLNGTGSDGPSYDEAVGVRNHIRISPKL